MDRKKPRGHLLQTRLDDDTMAWLKSAAKAQGRPVANYLRWLVVQAAREHEQRLPAQIRSRTDALERFDVLLVLERHVGAITRIFEVHRDEAGPCDGSWFWAQPWAKKQRDYYFVLDDCPNDWSIITTMLVQKDREVLEVTLQAQPLKGRAPLLAVSG